MVKEWILKHLYDIAIAITVVLTPVIPVVLSVGVLVMTDFIFAIYVAYKIGVKITSNKMSKTISKLLLYTLTIICIFLLEKYVIIEVLPITKIAGTFISIIEIKSLDENFNLLFGWSLWDKMLSAIKRGANTTKDILEDDTKK